MVKTPQDLEKIMEHARTCCDEVVIITHNWKIIHVENPIAMVACLGCNLLTEVKNVAEVEPFINILEKGVDGVVVKTANEKELKNFARACK